VRQNAELAAGALNEVASRLLEQHKKSSRAPPRAPARVLVVEDQPSARWVFEKLLSPAGYEVICAVDSEEALRLLESTVFDLAVIDYVLPGASGAVLGFELQQMWPRMPIVYVSGYPDGEAEVGALHPGAAFVNKSALTGESAHILLDLIEVLLTRARENKPPPAAAGDQ